MAVSIIDGIGNTYQVQVDNTNRLMVRTEGISVATGSEAYIKGGSIQTYNSLGSTYVLGSVYTTGSITITNLINPGSIYISNIVGVSGTNFSDFIGSVRSQSIQVTSPWIVSGTSTIAGSAYVTGSINITTTLLPISGNVLVSGTINIGNQYLGSEAWIKAGSIQTYNPVGVGSVYVMNPIGISGINNIGSVVISSAPRFGVSGIVEVSNMVAGSIVYMPAVNVSEVPPNATIMNNPLYNFKYIISGTSTGVTGSSIGSIVMFIGAGSYVSVLSYLNNTLIAVGSYF